MHAATARPRDPLLLRLLLQVVRPETVQVNLHRWVAWLAAVLMAYLLWGKLYFTDWRVFLGASVFMQGTASLSTIISAYVTTWAYRRYPEPGQARRRLSVTSFWLVLMGVTLSISGLWILSASHLLGFRYNPRQGPWVVFLCVVLDLLLVGFFEITFAFEQWQTHQLGTERLEREQLQTQLTELKQQVNPHFLFNSLNSLSILISEDPTQAERFVDELAQVYRYQLQATRSSQLPPPAGLVPLEAELRFLRAYTYLLSVRYGAGLHVLLPAVEAGSFGSLLPLALQVLVDNAIRHNALSASHPLRIEVLLGDGYVRVRNTRHPRTVRVPMSSEGLASLQARYQRLARASPLIEADDAHFTVTLPLLASP